MKPTYYLSLSSEPFNSTQKTPIGMEIETMDSNGLNWNAQSATPELFTWEKACKAQQFFYNLGLELLIRNGNAPFMPAMRRPFMNNNCYEFPAVWIHPSHLHKLLNTPQIN